MGEHTPGPWTVHHFVNDWVELQDSGMYEVEEANEHISDLLENGDWESAVAVAEANRRLIEAAPDLLATAKMLLAYLETEDMRPLDLNAARAAIAKAEGHQ